MNETEITSLEQYTALEVELHTLAGRAESITEPDKKLRIEIRDTRVRIEKIGKYLRDDYNRLAKEVIAKEKELIGIIAPAEERLKSLEEAVEAEKERLYRVSRFEARKAIFETLGVSFEPEQNEKLSDTEFEAFYQSELLAKNERTAKELAEREQKVREEEERQARIKREEEMAESIREEEAQKAAKAIADAEERAKRAEQDAKEKAERDERARVAQEEADRIAKEKNEADEKKKLEQDMAYNMWLESFGYTEETKSDFVIEKYGNRVRLSKILSIYTIG